MHAYPGVRERTLAIGFRLLTLPPFTPRLILVCSDCDAVDIASHETVTYHVAANQVGASCDRGADIEIQVCTPYC